MIGVGVGLTQPSLVAVAAAPSLSVVASPSTLTWAPGGIYTHETGQCTATVTGGTAPYNYSWTAVSGSIGEALDVDGQRVVIFGADANDPAVMKCTVTDALLATADSNTVSIT